MKQNTTGELDPARSTPINFGSLLLMWMSDEGRSPGCLASRNAIPAERLDWRGGAA